MQYLKNRKLFIFTKSVLSFTVGFLFLLIFFFLNVENTEAAFICDSGTLDTTCYATSTQTLDDGETISGAGTLIIDGGELTTINNTTTHHYNTFNIEMGGGIQIINSGSITGNFIATSTWFELDSTSSIDLEGKGYGGYTSYGYGPAGGDNDYRVGSGGGNGGNGGTAKYGSSNMSLGGDALNYTDTLYNPNDYGSGGAGGSYYSGGAGGGLVRLNVSATTTIEGSIILNGVTRETASTYYLGGGAGGSIKIVTDVMEGSGSISADGGDGATTVGGGGGGGKIALYYTSDNSSLTITAYGGSGHEYGGAGTIYKESSSHTPGQGEIYIINSGMIGTSTPLSSGSHQFANNLDNISSGAKLKISSGATLTVDIPGDTYSMLLPYLHVYGTLNIPGLTDLTISSSTALNLESDSAFTQFTGLSNITIEGELINALTVTFGSFDVTTTGIVTNYGTITATATSFNFFGSMVNNSGGTFTANSLIDLNTSADWTNEGTVNFNSLDTLTIATTTIFTSLGTFNANNLSTLNVEGDLIIDQNFNPSSGMDLIVAGTLTHPDNPASNDKTYYIDLDLANFDLQTGGVVDLYERGYSGAGSTYSAYGPANGGNDSDRVGAGGGNGGNGGDGQYISNYNNGGDASNYSDSYLDPNDLGSGGSGVSYYAGGDGGGLILLNVSNTANIDGNLNISGEDGRVYSTNYAGGGSGGSVKIVTNILDGEGIINANGGDGGGNNGGGGGGGKIALYYNTDNSSLTITAYGGSGYEYGGAGTIYKENDSHVSGQGELYLDNGVSGYDNAGTPLSAGSCQFANNLDDMINDAKLIVSSSTILTVNPSGASYILNIPYLVVEGTLTVPGMSDFSIASSSSLTLESIGSFTELSGLSEIAIEGELINNISLSFSSLNLSATGNIYNYATIIATNTSFLLSGGIVNNSGAVFTANSLQNITSFADWTNNGTMNFNALETLTISTGTIFSCLETFNASNLATTTVEGTLSIDQSFNPNSGMSLVITGTLTYPDNPIGDVKTYYIDLDLANFDLQTGGIVDLEEKGYQGVASDNLAYGPAGGLGDQQYVGGGGGNGGDGGDGLRLGYTSAGGDASNYTDTFYEPNDLGSGGAGAQYRSGGDGGGLIILNVSNITNIDGLLNANGGVGVEYSTYYPGGGAGGSVRIDTTMFSGSGIIQANGGDAYVGTNGGGGGGGGKIAITYHSSNFNGDNLIADGGAGYEYGQDGTIVAGTVYTEVISNPYNFVNPVTMIWNLSWSASTTVNSSIKFQIRTAPDNEGSPGAWTDWAGPDNGGVGISSTTYFTDPTGLSENIDEDFKDGVDDQWVQVKIIFESNGLADNPVLYDYSLTYIANGPPEFESQPSVSMNDEGYVVMNFSARDGDTSTGVTPNNVTVSYEYSLDGGSNWTDITTGLSTGATSTYVDEVVYTSTTTYWYAKDQIDGTSTDSALIRITLNDNEIYGNIVPATSSAFVFDTLNPITGSPPFYISATSSRTAPTLANIYNDIIDDNNLFMRYSLSSSTISSEAWVAYSTTSSITILTDPDTVYAQFKDQYNNQTAILEMTTPKTPDYVMIQDTSNMLEVGSEEYRLFIAWKISPVPPSTAFDRYNIYRADSASGPFSLIGYTLGNDRSVNYYGDATTPFDIEQYYRVTTMDAYGNESFQSSTVYGNANGIQDAGEGGGGTPTTPPTILNVIATSTYTTQVTIEWETDILSNSTVGYDTATGTFTTEVGVGTIANNDDGDHDSIGKHSVTIYNLQANTTYYYQVKSTDPSGNTGTDDNGGAGYEFTTVSGPSISSVFSDNIGNTRAEIYWTTSASADSFVYVSTSSDMSNSSVTGLSDNVTSHRVVVANLNPGTQYYYYVKSDVAVDSNEGDFYQFRTTSDVTAPVITFDKSTDESGITDTGLNIRFETDELATSSIEYGETISYGSVISNENYNTNHIYSISGLSVGTTYYYRLLASDENGNLRTDDDAGSGYTFTTTDSTDNTAPTIQQMPSVTDITNTSARIYWRTDETATSSVEYGTATGVYDAMEIDNNSYFNHSITLNSLATNTTYYYQVANTDSNNNTVTSPEYSFSTTNVVVSEDTSAPVITSGPAVSSLTDTTAVIQWISDDEATRVLDYGVQSGVYAYQDIESNYYNNHSVNLTGLTPITTYYYKITLTNSDGYSSVSSEFSFTTNARDYTEAEVEELVEEAESSQTSGGGVMVIDKTDKVAPVISDIKVSDIKPNTAIITWQTNEASNSIVEYGESGEYEYVDGGILDDSTTHTVILKRLNPETNYSFRVYSNDDWANLAVSASSSFTTISREELAEQEIEEELNFEEVVELSSEELLEQATKKVIEIINSSAGEVSLIALENSLLDQYSSLEELAKMVPGPLLSGEPKVVATAKTATIAWATDKEANSLVGLSSAVDYDENAEKPYVQIIGNPDELVVGHSVTLYDLEPDTEYHYQVRSKGVLGEASESKDFIFTTLKEELNIANYSMEVINTEEANFKWITNIEADSLIRYTPYRNNILSVEETKIQENNAMSVLHEMNIPDFESGVTYMIELISHDFEGNMITEKIDVFSTSEEDLPPIIYQIQTKSALSPGKDIGVQTIISWMTNEPATTRLYYKEGIGSTDEELTEKTVLDNNYTKKHVAVLTNFKPGSVYRFRAESIDSGGNVSQSKVYTVLTPRQTESVFQVIMKNFEDVFGWVKNVR